ncbi:MAG: alpha/beta hydrolase-fold protein [Planctomycetota bacterium]|nr:alpha/beta hydrolase-fold protein [Planctomycetota bacterium]
MMATPRHISKFWLTVMVLSPIVVTGGLFWLMAILIAQPRLMSVPAIGAGAGDTGGANALGEWIGGTRAAAEATELAELNAAAEAAEAQAPKLVQPESLPQGFILIVTDDSRRATQVSPIYLAGSVNNWNPADAKFKLTPQSDMKWRIELPQPKDGQPIEFKFTRGSWELEELNADLSSPANRKLQPIDVSNLPEGEKPRIEVSVAAWGDMKPGFQAAQAANPYRTIQATGTVRRIQVQGGAGGAAGLMRDLLVWLPPGYSDPANANVRYPVLYLMDGQNLFESRAGLPAEWAADETATTLIEGGKIRPIIIVGVPNAGESRIEEYMPVLPRKPAVMGERSMAGPAFVRWLLDEVKPRVDRTLRTAAGPENTAIGGASLGGLISLYAGSKHPEVFGKVLAESPTLGIRGQAHWRDVFGSDSLVWPARVYVAAGRNELGMATENAERNSEYVKLAIELHEHLQSKGRSSSGGVQTKLVIDDGEHNEKAWASRLPGALEFLFGAK